MPWFRVDDAFHAHPKVMATSPAALGLWVVAGSWAAANPNDGLVPLIVLPRLVPEWQPLAKELVDRGLWHRVRGGYRFHDWDHQQPTKEDVQKKRAQDRDRQRKRRLKLAGIDETPQVTTGTVTQLSQRESRSDTTVSHATPALPGPALSVKREKEARGARLPDDWQPSPQDVAWSRSNHPDIDGRIETEKFRNHWLSEPGAKGRKLDWSATWRNWIIRAGEFAPRPTNGYVAPAFGERVGSERGFDY